MNDPVHEKIRNLYVSQNLERHMLSHHQMPQRSIPPPVSARAAVIVASAAYLYRAKETYRLLKRTVSPNKRPVLAAQTAAHAIHVIDHIARHYVDLNPTPDEDDTPRASTRLEESVAAFSTTLDAALDLHRTCESDAHQAGQDMHSVPQQFIDWTCANLIALSGYTAMLTFHQVEILTGSHPDLMAGHIFAAWAPQRAIQAIIEEHTYRPDRIADIASEIRRSALEAIDKLNSPNFAVKARNHRPTHLSERLAAAYPSGGNPALKALDRSATIKVAVTASPTPGSFIPIIAYRFEGAIHAKFADEPYSHRLDHITLLEHAGAIRKWAIDNERLDDVNSKALDPIWASAQDDLNQQTAR